MPGEFRTGESNTFPIVFREDGYINMTKAAKHFGKDLSNFVRSPEAKAYLKAMQQTVEYTECSIIQAKRGGRKGEAGTWCHPKLAVFFARWLDVRFAVWCDLMLDNILHGHIQTTVAVPTEEALAVDSVVASLRARVESLQENVKRLQEEGFKGGVPDGWLYQHDQGCKALREAYRPLPSQSGNQGIHKGHAASNT